MKKIYLVMMTSRGNNQWRPVHGWESKESAIKSIKRAVETDKELKPGTSWKYTIKELHLFLDLESPF